MSFVGIRGLAVLLAAGLFWSTTFLHAENFPQITPDEAKQSVTENDAAWRAKISAHGRPRLLYDKAGLAKIKDQLMSGQRSPEVQALMNYAYSVASNPPVAYATPEEHAKSEETSIYDASGELWIREVGNNVTMLAIAASLDPSPQLQKALHDAVITACQYPTWGTSQSATPANMDLSCAHMARGIALAWDWHPDLWTPQDRELIIKTITERVGQLQLGLYGATFWAHAYADNHNHVDTTALGWCGLAFYDEIPQAPEWLAAARLDFQNVAKYYPPDGSSGEGVAYWSYGLDFILQYIEGTRGIIDSGDLYQAPFLKNAALYRMNVSTCGLDGVLPWGDIPIPARDYYGPQQILNRLAAEYKDPSAAWLSSHLPWKLRDSDLVAWVALWQAPAGDAQTLPLDYHLENADIVSLRSGWGPGDYLLSIKSGFTNRNHSHLDAGALGLAFGNEWLLTAPGYGTGKSQPEFWDFDGSRWSFFSNATESHTALLVNGKNQRFDHEARGTIDSFLSAPSWSWTGIDLTQAYNDVTSIRRNVLHRRGDYILVFDSATAAQPVTLDWLAQIPADPKMDGNAMLVAGQNGQLRVEMLSPAQAFKPRQPTSPHVDIASVHTYSASTKGTAPRFITLLQPEMDAVDGPKLTSKILTSAPGTVHLVIQKDGWTDDIQQHDSPAATTLVAGISATAKLTALRTGAGAPSFLVTGATELSTPDIKIKTTMPGEFALQPLPGGGSILDSDQDLQGETTLPSGMTLQPLPAAGKSHRYFLAKTGTPLAVANDWLAAQPHVHEKAPVPVRALPPQPGLTSASTIAIEAEDFIDQRLGRAEVVEGKPGASGKSVRGFGNQSPDNSLSWNFDVATAGQYQLAITYATQVAEVKVAVLVDGAAPVVDLAQTSLPTTGGWSIKESNWKTLIFADAQGKPVLFNLAKGKHELRLAKPTDALALDKFEFTGAGK